MFIVFETAQEIREIDHGLRIRIIEDALARRACLDMRPRK